MLTYENRRFCSKFSGPRMVLQQSGRNVLLSTQPGAFTVSNLITSTKLTGAVRSGGDRAAASGCPGKISRIRTTHRKRVRLRGFDGVPVNRRT